ncbi:unnamed protein product [Calypogeia fissa]
MANSEDNVDVTTPFIHNLPPIQTPAPASRVGSPRYVSPAFRPDYYGSPRRAFGYLSGKSTTSSQTGHANCALAVRSPVALVTNRVPSSSLSPTTRSPPWKVQHVLESDAPLVTTDMEVDGVVSLPLHRQES